MSLISKWRRPVILPAMPERRLTAGKNTVTQNVFPRATVSALFFDSQYTGHDLIRLDLAPPFNEMLIRLPRAHRVDSPLPVLTALLLPRFSKLFAENQETEALDLARRGVWLIWILTIPVALVMVWFRNPIVSLVFGHGRMTSEAVVTVADLSAWSVATIPE